MPRWPDSPSVKNCLGCGKEIHRSECTNFARKKYCGNDCAHAAVRYTPEQATAAFWAKVSKGDGCWLWIASIKPRNGYGHLRVGNRDYNAHRYSYVLAYGEIPKGMEVMHICDVPHCVNPAHLKLGTHDENMADCKAKGRTTHGERSGKAKLTAEHVRHIKAEYRKGRKHRSPWSNSAELAARYGVGTGAIAAIIRGHSWKHIK